MTSYQEQIKQPLMEKYNEREKELKNRIQDILKDAETFLTLSPEASKLVMRDTQEDRMYRRIENFLQREYKRVSFKRYENMPEDEVFPPFNVMVTNNPAVFAEALDTKKSKEMECVHSGYGNSRYAYKQRKWDSLINLNVKINNPDTEKWVEVDFQTNESYLLFGRTSHWEESERKNDIFVQKGDKLVKEIERTKTVWTADSKEFILMLYVPAEPGEKLVSKASSIEKEVKRLTAPATKEKSAKKGFFARLLGCLIPNKRKEKRAE